MGDRVASWCDDDDDEEVCGSGGDGVVGLTLLFWGDVVLYELWICVVISTW